MYKKICIIQWNFIILLKFLCAFFYRDNRERKDGTWGRRNGVRTHIKYEHD